VVFGFRSASAWDPDYKAFLMSSLSSSFLLEAAEPGLPRHS
jgi:hypothetical protein